MLEFHPEIFTEFLHSVPEKIPYCETPQHSEYLQTEVFDRLRRGETIDLTKLDLNAFDLCHTAMAWSEDHYRGMEQGWQKGFNKMLKLIQASPREKRAFF
jgi:hypothetical protein